MADDDDASLEDWLRLPFTERVTELAGLIQQRGVVEDLERRGVVEWTGEMRDGKKVYRLVPPKGQRH